MPARERREPREPLVVDVAVDLGELPRQYRAVDLSALGIRVTGPSPLEQSTVQSLRVSGAGLELTIVGRVVWCQPKATPSDDDRFEAGLELVELTSEDQSRVREYISGLREH